eukprot:9485057-Pyramimonas_sp.AAC.1
MQLAEGDRAGEDAFPFKDGIAQPDGADANALEDAITLKTQMRPKTERRLKTLSLAKTLTNPTGFGVREFLRRRSLGADESRKRE